MPYPNSLSKYVLPEFSREAPEGWVRRLREISPITEYSDHLVFRWMEPQPSWRYQRGCWLLYAAIPRALINRFRAALFEKHWSQLRTAEQPGREDSVSDYQHYMWHTQGVDVFPFWVLHGDGGGTPSKFTRAEARLLTALGMPDEPQPLGYFPPCPFDERAVTAIKGREELLAEPQMGTEELEQAFRRRFLGWWMDRITPQAEFMHSAEFKKSQALLPDAPKELPNVLSAWKEHFIEHGVVIGAGNTRNRKKLYLVQ